MNQQALALAPARPGLDAVTQWGLVIEGFQITEAELHRAVTDALSMDPAEAETLLRLMRSPDNKMPRAVMVAEAMAELGSTHAHR